MTAAVDNKLDNKQRGVETKLVLRGLAQQGQPVGR